MGLAAAISFVLIADILIKPSVETKEGFKLLSRFKKTFLSVAFVAIVAIFTIPALPMLSYEQPKAYTERPSGSMMGGIGENNTEVQPSAETWEQKQEKNEQERQKSIERFKSLDKLEHD